MEGALLLRADDERLADLRSFARGVAPGTRYVLTDPDPERAAGVAERLCALGVDADWRRTAA